MSSSLSLLHSVCVVTKGWVSLAEINMEGQALGCALMYLGRAGFSIHMQQDMSKAWDWSKRIFMSM